MSRTFGVVAGLALGLLGGCGPRAGTPAPAQPEWTSLFDGKTLDGWTVTPFGGEGKVYVRDGELVLEAGVHATGITIAREIPRMNYEISLEAKRVDGSDFFCGLTFPVGEDSASLICGGWGGSLVGISSLDGMDASENETSRVQHFEQKRWYRIRVRVTAGRIEAWIDDEPFVDVKTEGRRVSIRMEVDLSRPLGIATWVTTGALREIKIRRLP
jgi:hypothetical protein